MADEPAQRFASVAEFSADIERYLEKRPVLARPPSRFYTFARACARNKTVTALAAALALTVLGGVAAATWEAQIAARRFDSARGLIYTVIHDVQPQLASVNGATAIRQSLIQKTLVYLEALWKDAGGNPNLTAELLDAYVTLASVAGDPSTANTGNIPLASGILTKAEPLAAALSGRKNLDGDALVSLSKFYNAAARNREFYGSPEAAQTYARRGLDAAERLARLEPGRKRSMETLATALTVLAALKQVDPEAITLYERVLTIYQGLAARDPSDNNLRNTALAYKNLASIWLGLNEFQRSLDAALQARQWDEKLLTANPSSPETQMSVAFDLGAIGAALDKLNRLSEAAQTMRANIAIREKVAAANPDDRRVADRLAYALRDLAEVEQEMGDPAAARLDYTRTLDLYEKLARRGSLVPQSLDRFASASVHLATIESQAGKKERGCALFRQAANLFDELHARGSAAEIVELETEAHIRAKSCAKGT
jgi:tetratricopeptide (TPR) repeat protein